MKKIFYSLFIIAACTGFDACSRKSTPPVVAKAPATVKTPVPKVITVNDAAASKTFDGRLYYDLEGHRYWRNKKDGKYYLYSKAMQGNVDFKP